MKQPEIGAAKMLDTECLIDVLSHSSRRCCHMHSIFVGTVTAIHQDLFFRGATLMPSCRI